MSQSLKYTSAEAFQAYAINFEKQFLNQLFKGFITANVGVAHAGVKGELVLTESIMGDLVKRWNKTFTPVEDALEFKPRILKTVLAKIDLEIYPQEFESSYLALMMDPGQSPEKLPFQKYIIDQVLAKKNEECENAIWVGAEAAVPASTDLLAALFDGYMTIAKAEATAGNLTAVTTGALTVTNAVASFESVYDAIDEVYKKGVIDIFCSKAAQTKYIKDYRTRYGANTITSDYMQFDLGKVNWNISQGTGDFILMTPQANMHYGFDGAADGNTIRFEASKRAIAMMMDFRIGCNFGIVSNKIMRINDQ